MIAQNLYHDELYLAEVLKFTFRVKRRVYNCTIWYALYPNRCM